MRPIFLIVGFIILLAASDPATADEQHVDGQSEPQYLLAVEDWLGGRDLSALETLAELSREGNPAAQILLASIATRAQTHIHVTSDLSRKERIALLRKPKGLSGASWLSEAAKTEPLAVALLQSTRIGERAAAITGLIEMGETDTALLAMNSVNSPQEAGALLDALIGIETQIPSEADLVLSKLIYLATSNGSGRYVGSARAPRGWSQREGTNLSDLTWGAVPGPRQLLDDAEKLAELIDLSRQVNAWTPLRRFCEKNCSSAIGECTVAGAFWLRLSGPFGLRSPVQSLIPNDVYWSSARMEGDLARSVPALDRLVKFDESPSMKLSACFVDAMNAAQLIHGHGNF